MTGYVYFIRPVGMAGPIKVGHSTFPPSRLSAFQTWSPFELEIISHLEAPLSLEKLIHDRFAKWQVRGEWFEPVNDLVDLAEGIRDGKAIEDLVDLSVPTGRLFRRPNTKSPLAAIVGSFKLRVERARQYASAVAGRPLDVPDSVRCVLGTAGGYRQEYRALTAQEVEVLEAYIAKCRAPQEVAA